ncbi:MAG: hypothetical protein IJW40_07115 [Clostridia bacterium]|nr:hypothetical protein [Clostridia bacterium]
MGLAYTKALRRQAADPTPLRSKDQKYTGEPPELAALFTQINCTLSAALPDATAQMYVPLAIRRRLALGEDVA